MSKEITLKLEWERRDEETLRGYLSGHPETTLFLLSAANPQGDVKLRGAFVPDAEEQEVWDIENAKAAAGKYMLDWIGMVANQVASNAEVSEPGDRHAANAMYAGGHGKLVVAELHKELLAAYDAGAREIQRLNEVLGMAAELHMASENERLALRGALTDVGQYLECIVERAEAIGEANAIRSKLGYISAALSCAPLPPNDEAQRRRDREASSETET
jgi:hypothetical protein